MYTFSCDALCPFPHPEKFIPEDCLPITDETAVKLQVKGETLKAHAFLSLVSAVEFNLTKETLDEAVREWRLGETYIEASLLSNRQSASIIPNDCRKENYCDASL